MSNLDYCTGCVPCPGAATCRCDCHRARGILETARDQVLAARAQLLDTRPDLGPELDAIARDIDALATRRDDGEDLLDLTCKLCAPFDCDDPDRHLGVPSEYTPLKNRGCICGADFDGRDCMCFEDMPF